MPLHDHALPADFESVPGDPTNPRTPIDLDRLASTLASEGTRALSEIGAARLLEVWGDTVEAFLDRSSAERKELDAALARNCRLSLPGLHAGLEAVLGGVRRAAAKRLVSQAQPRPARHREEKPALVILASNLPALAVQPLLPALACGRPVILKSPTSEPLFAPAFLRALGAREPRLRHATAALTWRGGDRHFEELLLTACDPVIAYGEADTLASLERRTSGRLVAYGPKTSLAVISQDTDLALEARRVARDVALFDQRGCLSVAAVYTDGSAAEVASALAAALAELSDRWPPGPALTADLASVQQLRAEAELRGLALHRLAATVGTVLVEPNPAFHPSPGLRTVRVHPLSALEALPPVLAPWEGQLQGAALAGEGAWKLQTQLERLGISRCAAPGDLQSPDASWHNGGISPLSVLG